ALRSPAACYPLDSRGPSLPEGLCNFEPCYTFLDCERQCSATGGLFILKIPQVPVVDGLCDWYILVIPAVVACLVAANQQHRRPPRVECIEDTVGPSLMLNTQLAHMRDVTLQLLKSGAFLTSDQPAAEG